MHGSGAAALVGPAAASFHTPTDCGMFQLALMAARYLPDGSGAGEVSAPSPVVSPWSTCFKTRQQAAGTVGRRISGGMATCGSFIP
jgi:hypothetical protein